MTINRKQLVREFVSAIHENEAALFVGAGLSRASGFVDWKGLLKDCAKEIGLDIDKETDLVAVAQYYLNRRLSDRSKLNQIIKAEFDGDGTESDNHRIIAQLPISTVWTSNFDNLLENAYRKAKRKVTVQSRDKDLAIPTKDKDVIVYKMHGDIARPDEVIICKDDYERYAIKHPVFQNALEGDLVKKTFLFLGFSFTDPHLEYMLGHLRSLLKESKREHFAIMREVIRADFSSGTKGNKEYKYAKNRQQLQIEDLTRYSIQTLLIKDFKEIPEVLSEIKDYYYQKNIFVSGSAKVFGEFGEERLEKLCYDIGAEIINKGFNLVSGFGLNVGSNAIMGALNSIFSNEKQQIEKRLLLRPFPQTDLAGEALNEFQKKYREDMISKCGFALFVAGNKEGEEVAQGVMQEFEIAKKLRKIPIPIGSTGFASKKIWDEMEIKLGDFFPNSVSKKIFKNLNDSNKSNGEIIKTIFEIIDKVRN